MIDNPYFWACAIPAVLIFGIAKGGFGGTLGILSVPIMSLVVSPLQAAAILLPLLCVMDIFAISKFWKKWDSHSLKVMLPAAAVGVVIGGLSFKYLSEDYIRLLVGILALIFGIMAIVKLRKNEAGYRPGLIKGYFWSAVSGFTSFSIHSGAPPASVYLVPLKLPPTTFVGTCAVLFAMLNYLKIIPYAWLGQFNLEDIWVSVMLLPFAPVGVWIGYYLHLKISPKQFYGAFNGLLLIIGVKLIYDSLPVL